MIQHFSTLFNPEIDAHACYQKSPGIEMNNRLREAIPPYGTDTIYVVAIRRLLPILLFLACARAGDWPRYRGPDGAVGSAARDLPAEIGPGKNVIWKTPLPPGHSSPILAGPRIFLTAYEGEKLLTICLDRATGKIQWRREAPRPRMEEMQKTNSPASPTPVSDGRNVYVFFGDYGIICYGVDGDTETPPETPTFAEMLRQYDTNKDGKITPDETPAKLKGWWVQQDFNHDGVMDAREWNFYRAMKSAQNSILAVRAGGRGDVTDTRVLWRYRKSLPNVPSPLLYRDVLYLVKDGGVATTLNPKTGEVLKQARLQGAIDRYWASPVAADGKVYMLSEACKLTVLKAGGEWEPIAMSDLDDMCFATPAIADSRLYIRTRSMLYAFG